MRAESPFRPGWWKLAAFSSPMIGVQAFELAWRVYLPAYIATSIGLSLVATGALIMALRLWDGVIDPVIAWASDRFPTRFGHRRPWMVAGLVPLLMGIPVVFFAWPSSNVPLFVLSALLMHLGYMLLVTPHGGWALEMGGDAAVRLRVIAAKTWFGIAGMVLVPIVPAMLEKGLAVGREGQVAALGLFIMLLFPLAVLLVLATVPEPRLSAPQRVERANPLRLVAGILRTSALRPILLLYLCSGFAEAGSSAVFLLFVGDGLGLDGWGSILIVVQSVLSLAALPLWIAVGDRVDRRGLLMAGYGWQAAMALLALVLPASSIGAAIMFVMLRGLFSGLDFLFLRAIVSDIARASADAGIRNGASFYAVSNLTLKFAFGAGAWAALALVQWLSGTFVIEETGRALAVRLSYALPSATAAVLAVLVLLLSRARRLHHAGTAGDPQVRML